MLSLPWAQNNSFVFFIAVIVVILILRELLIIQLRKKVALFYSLFYPGVILHETGHLIGCIICGARIQSFKIVSSAGGEVVHEKSKIPVIGSFIISVFPLILGSSIIYLITIKVLNITLADVSIIWLILLKLLSYYLLIAVILTTLPSYQDFKNAPFIYAILFVAAILVIIKTNLTVPVILTNIAVFCALTLSVVNLIMLIFLKFEKNRA